MTDILKSLVEVGPLSLIVGLIIIWFFTSKLSYEFFISTETNRFRFRFWTVIAIFNMFHLLLAVWLQFNYDPLVQNLRWQIFFLIDILYLEIFINGIKNRELEISTRALFYFLAILNIVVDSWIFSTVNGMILIGLASRFQYPALRKSFMVNFGWYILAMSAPYWDLSILSQTFQGSTKILSLGLGMIFSLSLVRSIKKLYLHEQVEEKIKLINQDL